MAKSEMPKMKDLKKLSKDELAKQVRDLTAELFQTRMQLTTGQLQDSAKVWRTRKTLARVQTLLAQPK